MTRFILIRERRKEIWHKGADKRTLKGPRGLCIEREKMAVGLRIGSFKIVYYSSSTHLPENFMNSLILIAEQYSIV